MAVTIASVRAHGVRQLLVYCLGKREAIGSVIIRERCQLVASALMRSLEILKAAAAALSADGGGLPQEQSTERSRSLCCSSAAVRTDGLDSFRTGH
jgi:hypothetical protein